MIPHTRRDPCAVLRLDPRDQDVVRVKSGTRHRETGGVVRLRAAGGKDPTDADMKEQEQRAVDMTPT